METKRGEIGVVFLIFLAIVIIVLGIYISSFIEFESEKDLEVIELNEGEIELSKCRDGTEYGQCSTVIPSYYCEGGRLVKKASLCGCSEEILEGVNNCNLDEYKLNETVLKLNYVLRGKENVLEFKVYGGVYSHLASLPREITTTNYVPTLTDFKYRNLEEKLQKEFLLELVSAIEGLAPTSKIDQARIAISIVQNMPYGFSDKYNGGGYGTIDIGYTRYPYETLYDQQGLCGEKSELLVFLLKEIGYDAIFLRYFEENHEVVGIKCPKEESLHKSGYCFVEATRPSIIGDSFGFYQGIGELDSLPTILDTSDNGKISLPENMYEYNDARQWVVANKVLDSPFGWINAGSKKQKEELEIKYGL